MVSPEGIGSEPDRPRSGRGLLFAVAGLVIAGGFVALGALSPAGETAVETTTTTPATTTTTEHLPPPFDPKNFEVSQIESGPQFEWTHGLTLDEGYPFGLIEHGGSLYLFVNEQAFWSGQSGDLDLWKWDGTGAWHDMGSVVGADHNVIAMTSTDDEVILVSASLEDHSVTVWRSADLTTWVRDDISVESDEPFDTIFPGAVGVDDDTVVVTVSLSTNYQTMIEEALGNADSPVDLESVGWGLENDAVVIYGPFGMTVERIPFTDLGWDEDTQASVISAYNSGSESKSWVQEGGGEWQEIELEGIEGVESILPYPGGGLMATGWGSTGMVRLVSTDGGAWSQLDGNEAPWMVRAWGDRFVALGERSTPGLLVSDDGESWESLGPGDRFPVGIHWSTDAVAASTDGVVFTTSGLSPGLPDTLPSDRALPRLLELGDGVTLTLDFESGRLDLNTATNSFSWQMYSSYSQDGITADFEGRMMVFSDPETGVALGTVPFDVLSDAEESYHRDRAPDTGHRALVFTPDGETWSIQDAQAQFGNSSGVGPLVVGAGHVAAIAFPDWWWSTQPFEVWTAPLP